MKIQGFVPQAGRALAPDTATGTMSPTVMTRFVRFWIYALVAAQVLLAVPATSFAASLAQDPPCMGMTMGAGEVPCPCCPDGVDTMTACLSACTATAAALPALLSHSLTRVPNPAVDFFENGASTFSEPPPNPPPIR